MTHPGAGASPVPAIGVDDVLRAADRGEPFLLLDVRNEDEAKAWTIEAHRPIATLHVPYFDFIENEAGSVARIPRGREVIVVCAHGGSSEMVAGMLVDAGVPARHVQGGMVAYGEHLDSAAVPLEPAEAARFTIWQINRRGKGCLSYIVASNGEAIVVDPMKNVGWYLAFAARHGVRIIRVLDTHIHADHVSGGPALAERLGVPYSVSAGEGFELRRAVAPLDDGEITRVGADGGIGVEVRVLRTPGHTPGSTTYLVGRRFLMTGDTLFVSGVGRPDLAGHLEEWGRVLFTTLTARMAALADDAVVLPAHYAGVHEIGPDGVVCKLLGEVRRTVPELQVRSAEAFLASMRAAVRIPPPAYSEISRVNLGLATASIDAITEWELGKNECAVSVPRKPASR